MIMRGTKIHWAGIGEFCQLIAAKESTTVACARGKQRWSVVSRLPAPLASPTRSFQQKPGATVAPGVLVLDSFTGGLHLEFLREVRRRFADLKLVLIGMEATESAFLQAVREGVLAYIRNCLPATTRRTNGTHAAGGSTTRGSLRHLRHYRGKQLIEEIDSLRSVAARNPRGSGAARIGRQHYGSPDRSRNHPARHGPPGRPFMNSGAKRA
jgi:hypothetical protein